MSGFLLAFLTKPKHFDWQWTIKAFLCHFALGFLVGLVIYLLLMRLFSKISLQIFLYSLLAAFLGAIASVAIDLDHFLGEGRPLHKLAEFIAIILVGFNLMRLGDLWMNKRRGKEIELSGVDRILRWWIVPAISIIVHVREDYMLGWF